MGQTLFNVFKNFYNHLDLDSSQGLKITKAIIEFTDSSGGSSLVQNKSGGGTRFEENAMVRKRIGRSCIFIIIDHFLA